MPIEPHPTDPGLMVMRPRQYNLQRPWVGLTDEEMSDAVADMEVDFGDLLWKVVCLTKLIEAKLKERNT